MSLMYMNSHTILKDQLYAWTKSLTSYWAMQGNHCPCVRVTIRKQIRNMSGMAPAAAFDWAEEIKYLVDVMYPDAEKIILVMDNLNTHKPASLYKRYPADEARRIIKRLEIHYTPKHGSWLDIAEIELNVMTRQCLSRRIGNIANLREELAAWEVERNTVAAKVNWQFRTADARVKLSSLYPKFTTASE